MDTKDSEAMKPESTEKNASLTCGNIEIGATASAETVNLQVVLLDILE